VAASAVQYGGLVSCMWWPGTTSVALLVGTIAGILRARNLHYIPGSGSMDEGFTIVPPTAPEGSGSVEVEFGDTDTSPFPPTPN
jgi:hypothetical protein